MANILRQGMICLSGLIIPQPELKPWSPDNAHTEPISSVTTPTSVHCQQKLHIFLVCAVLYCEYIRRRSHIYDPHIPQTNTTVECESLRHTSVEFTKVTHLISSEGANVCSRSVLQSAKRNDVIRKYFVCGCLRSLIVSPPSSIPGPVIPDFCTLEERGALTGWCRRRWRNTARIHTHPNLFRVKIEPLLLLLLLLLYHHHHHHHHHHQ